MLYEEDLYELEKLLSDSYTHQYDKANFTLTYKEKQFSAPTVTDLLKFEALPESTDKLSISRKGWVEEGEKLMINRGINITMYHNYISCQIFSYDEDWYKGKISRLKEFFKARKPWYSFLTITSPFFPIIAMLSFWYSAMLIIHNKLILAIAPSCLFLLLIYVSIMSYQKKMFPYVKIILSKKQKFKFGLNEFKIFIVILASLATILQFIFSLLTNKK